MINMEENRTSDLEFMDDSDLKVVYILFLGVDADGMNIYRFLLSDNCEDTFAEGWSEKPAGNIPKNLMQPDNSMFQYEKELKTELKLDLAQDNTCFSMQDCRDHIVALAYENLDEAEEYPEPCRIVIQFGDNISEVEEMFAKRDMRLRFV